jgi:hypothetical protein
MAEQHIKSARRKPATGIWSPKYATFCCTQDTPVSENAIASVISLRSSGLSPIDESHVRRKNPWDRWAIASRVWPWFVTSLTAAGNKGD